MADGKKGQTTNTHNTDPLRAGVDKSVEKEARAEAKENFEDKIVTEHEAELEARDIEEDGLLAELPEDGAVVDQQEELAATAIQTDTTFGRAFEDEFTGRGGTFVIDAKTGKRKRQYEAVRDPKNPDKIKGYRPAV